MAKTIWGGVAVLIIGIILLMIAAYMRANPDASSVQQTFNSSPTTGHTITAGIGFLLVLIGIIAIIYGAYESESEPKVKSDAKKLKAKSIEALTVAVAATQKKLADTEKQLNDAQRKIDTTTRLESERNTANTVLAERMHPREGIIPVEQSHPTVTPYNSPYNNPYSVTPPRYGGGRRVIYQ